MSNTPDLASIVKPLNKTADESDGYTQFSSKLLHIQYVIGPDFDVGYYVDTELKKRWANDSYQEALEKVNDHYNEVVLSLLDLTKLQQPEPFWKPIDDCPKEKGVKYDLWGFHVPSGRNRRVIDCEYNNGWIGISLNIFKPLAFAEIPPCEVKP